MGLRDRIRKVIDRLSGEHSAAAPERREDYARPGQPNEEAKVVMARLRRPGAADEQGDS